MFTTDTTATDIELDLDAALNPGEVEGLYRDSRECAYLALLGGGSVLLLSPPTPRPKKG
ncbi:MULTISPECIES: hypothetical protein [Streptomyces]|uniref:hypothetical protein n=1 Tax=Streptomyces TaxID=1883 RepID=UPI000B311172|nr:MULTISPECIES: hypothetical protein [unclassified Streptomyces]QNQ35990.1 hypothetical protein HYC88_21500 [Streptomyces sp. CB00271]